MRSSQWGMAWINEAAYIGDELTSYISFLAYERGVDPLQEPLAKQMYNDMMHAYSEAHSFTGCAPDEGSAYATYPFEAFVAEVLAAPRSSLSTPEEPEDFWADYPVPVEEPMDEFFESFEPSDEDNNFEHMDEKKRF